MAADRRNKQMIRQKKKKLSWIGIGLAVGMLWTTAACGHNQPGDTSPGGGTEDHRTHSLYDRDSRNNEDATLGVKPKWEADQKRAQGHEYLGLGALDNNNEHLTRQMRFDPRAAEVIKQLPGVHEAQVLLTEANAYVAVVLEGQNPDSHADPQMMSYQVDQQGKGGIGLFGTDVGTHRINWTDPDGMTASLQDRIRLEVLRLIPDRQRVFSSSNANFVQRVRFYAKEEQEKGTFSQYVNEFNTMVQYVFPDDVNTRR
jgi:hypothetical protein